MRESERESEEGEREREILSERKSGGEAEEGV